MNPPMLPLQVNVFTNAEEKSAMRARAFEISPHEASHAYTCTYTYNYNVYVRAYVHVHVHACACTCVHECMASRHWYPAAAGIGMLDQRFSMHANP